MQDRHLDRIHGFSLECVLLFELSVQLVHYSGESVDLMYQCGQNPMSLQTACIHWQQTVGRYLRKLILVCRGG